MLVWFVLVWFGLLVGTLGASVQALRLALGGQVLDVLVSRRKKNQISGVVGLLKYLRHTEADFFIVAQGVWVWAAAQDEAL